MGSVERGTPDDIARQETADEIDNSEDVMWFNNDLCLETPQKQTTLNILNRVICRIALTKLKKSLLDPLRDWVIQ